MMKHCKVCGVITSDDICPECKRQGYGGAYHYNKYDDNGFLNRQVTVSITEKQYDEVRKYCKDEGVGVSEFFRNSMIEFLEKHDW